MLFSKNHIKDIKLHFSEGHENIICTQQNQQSKF